MKNISVRIVAFVALIAVLGVPAGFLAAHARQQEQQAEGRLERLSATSADDSILREAQVLWPNKHL